jgi:hypothetical protein
METIKVKIIGTRPLLMHADILSDPLNAATKAHKAVTSKRKKTDDDYEFIAKSEWSSGLYFDDDIGPYIPGANIDAALVSGAKLCRLGTQIKRSAECIDERCRLEYEGPRTVIGLWDKGFYDARTVKNPGSSSRIVRYRPVFHRWSLECEIAYDPESIDRDQVVKCLKDAGIYSGIGDYRPKFGRFDVEVVK